MTSIHIRRLAYVLVLAGAGCSGSGGGGENTGGTPGGTGGVTTSTGGTGPGTGGVTTSTGGTGPATGGAGPATGGAGPATGGKGGSAGPKGGTGPATGGSGPATGGSGPATGGSGPGTGGAATVDRPQLVTSADGAWFKTGTLAESTATADVTVNDGSAQQTFEGFGGAFNEMGWTALSGLSQGDRDMALQLLFGQDGARFVLGRIPIGASDYAKNRYTLNETSGDNTMSKFSIERDKEQLIPYIKAALAVNPKIRLWGSPWTPPTWMKSGASNGGFDRGNMKEDATTFGAFALYLTKFVQEYGKEGMVIEAVAPQNEPGFAQDYPSCLWTGAGMATFIGSHLGPTFMKENVTAKIVLGTMSNGQSDPAIVSAVTGNATAMGFVKVFGMQWGMLDKLSGVKGKGLPIWQTEHKAGNCPFSGAEDCSTVNTASGANAPNNFTYANESWNLIKKWIGAGATSYSAWNMVLDPKGNGIDSKRYWAQNALIVADPAAKKLTPTPAYYVFRHFSQFVDPGAKVVGTSGGDAVGFKNPDGSIIAVIYNSGAAKKMTASLGGKKFQFDAPNRGWVTVNYKP